MGVYIKGINYAECNKCPLNLMAISETCSLNKKKCPLVEVAEPHGRLIDADALVEKAEQEEESGTTLCIDSAEELEMLFDDDAPTVIESDG